MAPTTPEIKVVPFHQNEGEPDPAGWAGYRFMVGETSIAYMANEDAMTSLVWFGDMKPYNWEPKHIIKVVGFLIPDAFLRLKAEKKRITGGVVLNQDVYDRWDLHVTVSTGQRAVLLGDDGFAETNPRLAVGWKVGGEVGKESYENALRQGPHTYALLGQSRDVIGGTREAAMMTYTPAHTVRYAESLEAYDAGLIRGRQIHSELRILRRPPFPVADEGFYFFLQSNSYKEIVAKLNPEDFASKMAKVAKHLAEIGRPGVEVAR